MRSTLICLTAFTIAFSSCSKQLESENNALAELRLDSVFPETARIGDTITLFGHGLAGITNPQIRINNATTDIVEKNDERIKFVIRSKFSAANLRLLSDTASVDGPRMYYRYIATVTTAAGTGDGVLQDGPGSSASFHCPWGLAFDKNGLLLVADNYNHRLRKIDLSSGSEPYVSSVDVTAFQFYNPYNIAVDTITNMVFMTNFNTALGKIDALGNGSVFGAPGLRTTTGVAIGADQRLYISDNVTHMIYSMTQDGSDVKTVTESVFTPRNLVFDPEGRLYTINSHVMEVLDGGSLTHFKQDHMIDGWEFAIDADGNFFEADHFQNKIQMVDRLTGRMTVIAGNGNPSDVDGIGTQSSFNGPMSLVFDKEGNLYVSTYNFDTNGGNKIRKITLE